ncbi:GNAT family N-acetyltransferase [Labedella endophytica]|uniref:GNAT family N-acetyltransferase n=1 Tax=Labedella endophytica TaxID=1523160 RepID=A0A433JP83_9MICO|nr:GNAT family N-acetyltransferase [Labedella endophytica]RUQ98178.1 GNAT family N-acetyltransferase [Labedella endophytica]
MAGKRIELVPTDADSMPALLRLFDDPSFDGWGGPAPLTPDVIAAKYAGGRLPEVECFIVEVDASPAGLAILHADDDGAGGMDLILLPSGRGHGVGRSVVSLLAERAREVRGWQRLTVDPDLANTEGIGFWRSVGFTPVRDEAASLERQPLVLMDMVLVGP